ncbi:hypothetical protein BGAL_0252g00020 [Botrytis galanthina]|uniref:Uncharacterized protein n=1 Tax=Botrytis galanthina TaxID=278940 RepID=A0A4S8QU24_9HELO|nr:hypothetical protein BGAL_0252g00020 [Botrytis galanthina]
MDAEKAGGSMVPFRVITNVGPTVVTVTCQFNALYRGIMPQENIAVHAKYGPVVRIGPHHVSFASPEALQIIHGSRNAYPKSDFYKPTSPIYEGHPLFHLFSIQDVQYHSTLKKNIAGLYTKTAVLDLEPRIDSCVELFVNRISELSSNGHVNLDMSLWPHLYAFDCLGEINVSKKFGFLESGTDVRGMIAAADRILHMTGLYAQAPMLQMLQNVIKRTWSYTFAEVASRSQKPKQTSDMLNNFLKLQEEKPEKLSKQEITGSLMAGHDVLAITLRSVFYYLARTPIVLDKLRAEISSVESKYPLPALIPYSAVLELPYLDAVIHEALRIHANTGTILERVVPPEGAEIDGYQIPGGTIVGVNAWVIHRNTDIFGKDVDSFRPERWIEATNDNLGDMKRNMFSFGSGPRMCIGRNIAIMQISKLVVEFYRRFDAVLTSPERDWSVMGGWVTKQTDMNMLITAV